MKKALALILTLAILLLMLPLAVSVSATGSLFIETDHATYQVQQGDIVTYVYYLNAGGKVTSLDSTLTYDADGLELLYDEEIEEIFPLIDEPAVSESAGRVSFNFTNIKGIAFNKDSAELIRARFRVTAASGTVRINNSLVTLAVGENKLIVNSVVNTEPARREGLLPDLTPYSTEPTNPTDPTNPVTEPSSPTNPTEPTNPATEPTNPTDPTVPTDPTDPPSYSAEDVIINADGWKYLAHQGDIFEYYYYLNTGEKVCSLEADFYYDPNGMELILEDEEDETEIFPILGISVVSSIPEPGHVTYNYSSPQKGKKFDTDTSELIHATFRVTAASGEYEINNFLYVVAGADAHRYIYQYEVVDPLRFKGSEIPDLEPYGWEIGDKPTSAPTQPDTQPATQANTQPNTQPATSAPTQPATQPNTQPATSAPTQPATQPNTQPNTQPDTQPNTQPAADGVYVSADGVVYKMKQGDVFDYVFLLSTGNRLCSIDGELIYSVNGLELLYEEGDPESIFPLIMNASPTVNDNTLGTIIFNASNAKGIKNAKPAQLVYVQVRVTAASGEFEIKTVLHTVAGIVNGEMERYIYRDEMVKELPCVESDLPGRTPYNPDHPDEDDPTEPETQPETVPPTQPEPKYLMDAATGIRVYTELDAKLTVKQIQPADFNYYLYRNDQVKIYQISLTKNGAAVAISAPLKVTIPAAAGAKLFRLTQTTTTDLSVNAIDTTAASGCLSFMTDRFGTLILSPNGSVVKASLYGDVDGDNRITITDATHIQRWLADLEAFTEDQKRIGDTDRSGNLAIIDGTHIQRWLADIPSEIDAYGYPK